jgi:hypothetical protein
MPAIDADALENYVPDPVLSPLVTLMAREGVPVRAIARATNKPADWVRCAIQVAAEKGAITRTPKDDWTPGTNADAREPAFVRNIKGTDEDLGLGLSRLFRLTRVETAYMLLMLRKNEVTREMLHNAGEECRGNPPDPTEIKIVDVFICKLRKKLRPLNIEITTIWGKGYYMPANHRKHILDLINLQSTGTVTRSQLMVPLEESSMAIEPIAVGEIIARGATGIHHVPDPADGNANDATGS